MSIWADIFDRSTGDAKRKEDTIKPWYDEYDYPIIKRVFSKTISSDLVTVQPMAKPTGITFYQDFKI